MNKFSQLLLLTVFSLTLSGCSSLPKADDASDRQAKTFVPKKNMASIYVCQINNSYISTVYIDGITVGLMEDDTFFQLDVKPGEHVLHTRTQHGKWDGIGSKPVKLNAQAGRNYFVCKEEHSYVFVATRPFRQLEESQGRKQILESSLLAVPEDLRRTIASAYAPKEKEQSSEESEQATPSEPNKVASRQERLMELQKLKKDGLISESEYQAKKKIILDSL